MRGVGRGRRINYDLDPDAPSGCGSQGSGPYVSSDGVMCSMGPLQSDVAAPNISYSDICRMCCVCMFGAHRRVRVLFVAMLLRV